MMRAPSDQTWIVYQASTQGVLFLIWTTVTLASVVVQLGAVDVARVKKWWQSALEVVCSTVECSALSL